MAWTLSACLREAMVPVRSACLDAGSLAAHAIEAVLASRRARRTAAIGNLAILAALVAGALPRAVADPVHLAGATSASLEALPMLLLLASSALGSVLLLAGGRDRGGVSAGPNSLEADTGRRPAIPDARQFCEANDDCRVAELMARMGHDLRTPLNAIIGFSDIMQRELLGPLGSDRYQIYAEHIRESGVTLLQAIEQSLAVTEKLAEGETRERGAVNAPEKPHDAAVAMHLGAARPGPALSAG